MTFQRMLANRLFTLCPKSGITKLIQSKLFRTTVAVSLVQCTKKDGADVKDKIKFPDARTLSHEHLIQQACSVTVSSTTQLLTQTMVAIVDTAQLYKKSMQNLLQLLDRSLENLNNDIGQDELSDLIIPARLEVQKYKRNLVELYSLMDYVEKVVNSTAETSFLAGSEAASRVLVEHFYSASTLLAEEKKEIEQLEVECLKLQQFLIKLTSEYEEKRKSKKSDKNII